MKVGDKVLISDFLIRSYHFKLYNHNSLSFIFSIFIPAIIVEIYNNHDEKYFLVKTKKFYNYSLVHHNINDLSKYGFI